MKKLKFEKRPLIYKDKNMQELLVLCALKWGEISEGRAVELLGWPREKIREQVKSRCGAELYLDVGYVCCKCQKPTIPEMISGFRSEYP